MWITCKKQRIKKFKETGDSRYIYQNELDNACFQQDMAYGDLKYFTRRTVSDKTLRDKAFNIAKNPKYDGYQREIASMVYKFFDKKSSGTLSKNENGIKNENMLNKELAEEFHKPITRKYENSIFAFYRQY